MTKKILITGSTDGIGWETARALAAEGHHVLLHGRSPSKLEASEKALRQAAREARIETYCADLSVLADVEAFASAVTQNHTTLDVLINNAGVFNLSSPRTADGLDARFAVNTIAPYLLTKRLLPLLGSEGRVVNLSSAAQAAVDPASLGDLPRLSDQAIYAQSKLALTMWSRSLAQSLGPEGPAIIAVNPGSMLGSKMVKEAYGVPGGDLRIGADILRRAALSDEFAEASGRYFDNDARRFASPHPDALDPEKGRHVTLAIERILDQTRAA